MIFRTRTLAAILPIAVVAGHAGVALSAAWKQDASADQAALVRDYESHVTVGADRTATEVVTERFKIQAQSAIQSVSEQHLTFIEGIDTLETLEAYTAKADGRRIPVPAKNILTQDAAPDQPGIYYRDEKQRTIIFPDVAVGDTLVMTNRQVTAWGKLRGDFERALVFPRSAAYDVVKVTVEAPASIGLRVKATGNGVAETVDKNAGLERHAIVITPESYAPDEAGAVSVLDREPMVLMSTYTSYEDLGASYGRDALPKAAVTPDIAALANEITDGIADRKAQAAAIDAWMKRNIRYVGVYLSFGRVVPNDASTVLTNRFGDCKDKATLMMALLAAKGIAAEQVLVNLGHAYTVTELPTSIAFDHVILYLPELGLYDDPTADLAAFGVLSFETYDKPVVRTSAHGATFARTPAMQPGDHTSRTTTTINVAADGAVTGRTEDRDTGALALGLRSQGEYVQSLGGAAAARRFLQRVQTPGTGQFDLGTLTATADPAIITGTFALDKRFEAPVSDGRADLPVGLSLNAPPGTYLLGRRFSGRQSAFVCYAGRQVEDIEVTFALAWPLPQLPEPVVIDNPVFSYRFTAAVDARTVKIHREFVSRVERQACAPKVEATIAPDMEKVRLSASNRFPFGIGTSVAGGSPAGAVVRPNAALALGPLMPGPAALPPPAAQYTPAALNPSQPLELAKVAAAGETLRIEFLYAIEPDCSSMGAASVRIMDPPQHGRLTVEKGQGFTSFEKDNQRYGCNTHKSDGTLVFYQPAAGYEGTDSITLDIIFPTGEASKRRYAIDVR